MGIAKQTKAQKAKRWINEHKAELFIIGVGAITTGFLIAFDKGYKAGFMDGGVMGFHLTNKWWDEINPDLKLCEKWEQYKKDHPESVGCVY